MTFDLLDKVFDQITLLKSYEVKENQLIYLTQIRRNQLLSDYYRLSNELLMEINQLKIFEANLNEIEQVLRDLEVLKQ